MTQSPMRAADFVYSLGVNTHIPYTDGGYANISNIYANMKYLGISEIRDELSNGYAGSAPISSYITLAQEGVKFTICLFTGGAITTAALQSQLALVAQLNTAVPGSVIAVEGPNEINNEPISYNGISDLQGAVNLQQDIYANVHANNALKGVAIDYFTGYSAGSIAAGPNPATTTGLADFDNQHPYPNNGQAAYLWVNRTQALANETPATGATVYTETGYSTNGGTTGAVNPDVQAKYTLDLLMDDAQSGVVHTDLYQLMDAYQPWSPQGDDGFGLFDPNNAPKQLATAIHDLTTILADAGSTATSFTPTTLNYSVSALPATGQSLAIEKSNGATDIVVWAEPQIWNEATGTELQAPTTNVTVSLGGTYQTVEVFDPLQSATAIQILSNVNSVALSLTDHPLIVEVEPGQALTQDTLTLQMAEDAWQGNAQFTASVDGHQVGGIMTTSAYHSAGDANVFSLNGNWGQGQHTVQIQFINDAYGGSPSTDRNLFVDSIGYDGTTYAGTSASLFKNGASTFNVGGSTAVGTAFADGLTVHLSEDAWNGDCQFTLSIDGKLVSAPQAVTSLHGAGAWQDFAFAGNFGVGSHTIGITFTNDAYGGSPTTDRNLYVNGIDVNGQHYGSGVAALWSAGTLSFTVSTSK